jgi:hypothetical protein
MRMSMMMSYLPLYVMITLLLLGNAGATPMVYGPALLPGGAVRYVDVSSTHLPPSTHDTECLDTVFLDVDGDNDLDVFVATERQANLLLLNDGTGRLTDVSDARLPRASRDSEDAAAFDADGDGDLDLIVVSEDDQINEYYVNDGVGTFSDHPTGLPVTGVSNAIAFGDVDDDQDIDIVIGNDGQNFLLLNDGTGVFVDHTPVALPADSDETQDVELGDVDGDGDLDLVVGNEDDNRLLLNDGLGHFTAAPPGALPLIGPEETRDVDLADVDGDGDLDIFFGNVHLTKGAPAQNRLLINDGTGVFVDETSSRLPSDIDNTMDGDLDLATANYGDEERGRELTPYRIYLNVNGVFEERTQDFFPAGVTGHGFDLEVGDLNQDGVPDFYLCSGRSLDRLILSEPSTLP